MSTHPLKVAAAALLIVAGLPAAIARAELVVVEQSGTGYKAQQKLPDGASLSVPAGGHVKLKRLPDGTDILVDGPFDGPISNYRVKGVCPWWNPVCKPDKSPERGVTRGAEPAPGATRGME